MLLENYCIDIQIVSNDKSGIMKEMAEEVKKINKATGKQHYLIAESNLNDNRYINGFDKGGYGLNAQWNDDFHHSIHALSTKENN